MADNFSYTTAVLGLLNSLKDENLSTRERDEDRAFRFAMEKWHQEATATQRFGEIQLQGAMEQISTLNKQEADLAKEASTIGIATQGMTSQGGVQAANDLISGIRNKLGTIAGEREAQTERVGVIAAQVKQAQDRVQAVQSAVAEYNAGALDTGTAKQLMNYSSKFSKQGTEKWTLDEQEAIQALNDPNLKQALEPYKNAKGELDRKSPKMRGLFNLITTLEKEKVKNEIDMMNAETNRLNVVLDSQNKNDVSLGEKVVEKMALDEATALGKTQTAIGTLETMGGDLYNKFFSTDIVDPNTGKTIKNPKAGPAKETGGVRSEAFSMLSTKLVKGNPDAILSKKIAYNSQADLIGRQMYKKISEDVGNIAQNEGEFGSKFVPHYGVDTEKMARAKERNFNELVRNMRSGNNAALKRLFNRVGLDFKPYPSSMQNMNTNTSQSSANSSPEDRFKERGL